MEQKNMSYLVIGIEGLVGAGKTSICRELINEIPDTVLIHGGNLYRAIVATIIKNGNKLEDLKNEAANIDMKEMMDLFNLELRIENKETVIYENGKKIDEEYIQSKEISLAVSSLGGRTNEDSLFKFARNIIDGLKEKYNVIISGRGILNIYPACDYHIFITADLDERVKRKANQYIDKSEEEVRQNIIERDKLQKEVGYYDLSSITRVVDVTNCKTVKESTYEVLKILELPLKI